MCQAKNVFLVTALIFLCSLGNSFAAETQLRFVTWKSETAQMWDHPIADFEKQNPGVKVIREIGPQSSTQLHDLITQKLKNRDTEMDVFVMDVIWPAEFASAGGGGSPGPFFCFSGAKTVSRCADPGQSLSRTNLRRAPFRRRRPPLLPEGSPGEI